MNKFSLRPFDGAALIGFLCLPWLFHAKPAELFRENNSAVWIVLSIAAVLTLLLFLAVSALSSRHPGENIVEISQSLLGKPFARVYGAALALYFVYFAGVHAREAAETLKMYGMELTPIYVIAGLIILTALVMNRFGGNAIVKTAGFFFILILLGIIFAVLIAANSYNADHLFPILGNGAGEIAKSSLFSASLFSPVIALSLLAPHFKDPAAMRKSGVISIAVSGGAAVSLSLCFAMRFSPAVVSTMMSGFMEIGKSSYFNHFFYRFEPLLLFFIIFAALLTSTAALMLAQKSAENVLPKKKLPIVFFLAGIAFIFACLPENIFVLTDVWLAPAQRCSVLFLAGIPLFMLAVSVIKNRKRGGKA